MTVIPAYGRDYKSKAEVLADWEAGRDFTIVSIDAAGGMYINKEDALRYGVPEITFRYRRRTRVFVHKLKLEG